MITYSDLDLDQLHLAKGWTAGYPDEGGQLR